MNKLLIVAVVAFGLAIEIHAQDASKSRTLSWEALDAEPELFIDPFAELSPEQLQDLSYVRRVQWLIGESKLSGESNDAVKADRIARRLKEEGIDIAWLMVQRKRIRDLRDRQLQTHAASVVKSFDGQRVVLNGFAVPICSSSEGVSEFFLVPSIDFCNASAPPSTQVIYVKSSQGPAIDDRTTPLQVTGTLQQRTTKRSFIFPGQTLHFEADYAIEPTEIKLIDWRKPRAVEVTTKFTPVFPPLRATHESSNVRDKRDSVSDSDRRACAGSRCKTAAETDTDQQRQHLRRRE